MDQAEQITQPKRRGRPANRSYKDKQSQVIQIAKSNPELTIEKVAIEAGVCRQTASAYLAKYGINKQELDAYKDNQPDILLSLTKRIGESITQECIQKAPMRDRIVGLGILVDKFRLLTGQSTANVASWTHVVQQSQHVQVVDNKE